MLPLKKIKKIPLTKESAVKIWEAWCKNNKEIIKEIKKDGCTKSNYEKIERFMNLCNDKNINDALNKYIRYSRFEI